MLKRTRELIDKAYKQGHDDGYESGHSMGFASGKEQARAEAGAKLEQVRLYEYNKGFKAGSIAEVVKKIQNKKEYGYDIMDGMHKEFERLYNKGNQLTDTQHKDKHLNELYDAFSYGVQFLSRINK